MNQMSLPEFPDELISCGELRLEPMRREHAGEMFPLLQDEVLYSYTGGEAPASVESLQNLYAFREARCSPDGSERWLNWLVRDSATGLALGYLQATVEMDRATVAWVIGRAQQGKGHASKAANTLLAWLRKHNAPPIRACIHPEHKASQAVARRIGLHLTPEWIDGEQVWADSSG